MNELINVCTYVCMYVCMYTFMYLCMCMYVRIHVCIYVFIYAYVYMYVCTYLCPCIIPYVRTHHVQQYYCSHTKYESMNVAACKYKVSAPDVTKPSQDSQTDRKARKK